MPSSRSLTQDAGERPCEEPPVDLVHLARHTLGDAQLEREVLLLFVSQAGIYLDRLKEARDGQAWRHAAHTIKGAARGVGAWKVARRAEDAEQVKPDPECGRCREAVASIEREIDAASRFIRTLFSKH